MDQKKQSSKAVHYDSRYLDEHLKYKGILQQRGRYSNQVYRFAEYCKYICLVLLTIGLLFLLLSWASYFFRKERVIETIAPEIIVPDIIVRIDSALQVEGTDTSAGGPQISPEVQREIANTVGNSSGINQTISVFEHVNIDGQIVTTGYDYNPPFDDGLVDYDRTWCYASKSANDQVRRVNLFTNGSAVPYKEADRDLFTRGQFNRLKSGCGEQ